MAKPLQGSIPAARYPVLHWAVVGLLLLGQMASTPGFMEMSWHMKGLIGHYLEHSQEDHGLSFADFLRLHYGDLEQEHQDEHDHSGLPFKCQHPENLVFHPPQFPPLDETGWPEPLSSNGFAPLQFRERTWQSADPYFEIWQPPRWV